MTYRDEGYMQHLMEQFDAEFGVAPPDPVVTATCPHGRYVEDGEACQECGRPGQPVEAEPSEFWDRLHLGGDWLLDAPDKIPAIWGDDRVAWAKGQSLWLVGKTGVGKTTLATSLILSAIGVGPNEVLGMPVNPIEGFAIYMAMDRPTQIQQAIRRRVQESDREALNAKLRFWPGPPLADMGLYPEHLATELRGRGVGLVIIDSAKDAVVKIDENDSGTGFNRATQYLLAAGIEVLILHHLKKSSSGGIEDVYGSSMLTNGAGSVIALRGEPGSDEIELDHLKQPGRPIDDIKYIQDSEAGTMALVQEWYPAQYLQNLCRATETGATVADATHARLGYYSDDRKEIEKTRRALDALVKKGVATKTEEPNPDGRRPIAVYTWAG